MFTAYILATNTKHGVGDVYGHDLFLTYKYCFKFIFCNLYTLKVIFLKNTRGK